LAHQGEGSYRCAREQLPQWQQFIVHAVDERGDPISDYQIELYSMEDDVRLDLQLDPDIYKYGSSYRSYHVDVGDLVGMTGKVKVIAKSGSALVDYYGIGQRGWPELLSAIYDHADRAETQSRCKAFHCILSQTLLLRRVGTGRLVCSIVLSVTRTLRMLLVS
jgi:hypothetical protein